MPDYNDPNLGSQAEGARRQDEIDYQYASFAQLVAQDPDVQAFVSQHGGQLNPAQTAQLIQLVKQKFPNNGPAGWTLNASGQVTAAENKIPTFVKALAIEMGASLAIPAITALAGAGGASAGSGLAGGAMTPAGVAIAPSVDIGADALAGGLTAGIGSTGTLASLGDTGAAGVSDVGAGAAIPGAEASSAAPAAAMPVNTAYGPSLEQLGASQGQVASATGAGGGGFSNFVKTLGGWPTVIGAGANLAGSLIQSNAAGHAADLQAQAARDALNVQTQIENRNTGLNVAQANQTSQAYNQTVANLAPYRGGGASALSQLGYRLGLPGYQTGNTSVVNAPPPIVPVHPLAVPPPITPPGASQPGQAIPNQAYIPTNQITNGMPQQSTGNTWSSGVTPATVGEQRVINGQRATWDGQGWKAMGAA